MRSSRKSHKADRIVRHTLADGTQKIYRYAAKAAAPKKDTINDLLTAYCRSPEWSALREHTKKMYAVYHRVLLPVGHLSVGAIRRRDILSLRDALATARGRGAATVFVRVTSALFAWAVEREWIEINPTYRVKTLPGGHLPAWSDSDVQFALEHLPEHLRRFVLLAAYTGQRRGDLCAMSWGAYDGRAIRVVQGKTGEPLVVPVHPALKAELDMWPRMATTILTDKHGMPWRPERLTLQLPRALKRIGVARHLTVHGLRKLAAAHLADAGCSTHEIAAITGHRTQEMVSLYTRSADQRRLAESAVVKLTRNK